MSAATKAISFAGFSPAVFTFLSDLAENQNREWFEEHKTQYGAEVREPMLRLVAELGEELVGRGIPLCGDPKRSVFRIYRDIRFSQDKRPYKTHVGASLTRFGEKSGPGLLYIHVDPKGSFVAAGFYQPAAEVLLAIRQRAAANPREVRKMSEKLASKGLRLSADEESLKRVPREFQAVTDEIVSEFVRRKSFTVSQPLAQNVLQDRGLVAHLIAFAGKALPLLEFGWQAVDGEGKKVSGRRGKEGFTPR